MSNPVTVLVVEDEPLTRLSIVAALEDEGFIVFEAANADDAITELEANSDIQLVFTDVDMPGTMDGLRLADFVRNRWPPVHIIVTSGHRRPDSAFLPVNVPFFSKPYLPEDIFSEIRRMAAK